MRVRGIWLIVALLAAGGALLPSARAATADDIATPRVTSPPAGVHGHPLWDSWYDLASFGYQEAEYFVSGTAGDGAGNAAPYTTRIIVTRPTDPAKFNGTALLDWTNVTAQFENAVDTMEARQMLMREGFAYVHVSAQSAGICCTPLTPKVWDPVRYQSLSHPGDAYANDMFSQIAKAIRSPRADSLDPMTGLRPRYLIAAGQSQSASKLYNFVNTQQPGLAVIDGFLIHGGGSKTFLHPLTTKVLHLLSDNEAKPDTANEPTTDPNYRLWEIAGTAHSDYFIGYQSEIGLGARTVADAPQKTASEYEGVMTAAGNYGEQLHPMLATCVVAGATMPMHYATSSAIYQLDQWIKGGPAPVVSPRFAFSGTAQAKDDLGNSLGGMRMPPIDVPVARYQSTACPLGGFTIPLTDVELRLRYPTHADYYAKMLAATDAAVTKGWLLPTDAVDLMRRACAAKVRWIDISGSCGTYVPPASPLSSIR